MAAVLTKKEIPRFGRKYTPHETAVLLSGVASFSYRPSLPKIADFLLNTVNG
jgi:hypothetical protein